MHRYYDLREHLYDIKPDLMNAEGDINALRLAHRWKIPAVYIANLIRPNFEFANFVTRASRMVERYIRPCSKNPNPR
jgi:hypothetical protein